MFQPVPAISCLPASRSTAEVSLSPFEVMACGAMPLPLRPTQGGSLAHFREVMAPLLGGCPFQGRMGFPSESRLFSFQGAREGTELPPHSLLGTFFSFYQFERKNFSIFLKIFSLR